MDRERERERQRQGNRLTGVRGDPDRDKHVDSETER